MEGEQPGAVFVDQPDNPQLLFVATRFGFAQLLVPGRLDDEDATRVVLPELFRHPDLKGRYLLWYDPPQPCQRELDVLPDAVARRRTRIRLLLDGERFEAKRAEATHPPAGVELLDIDADVLRELEPLGLDIGGRFWGSDDAFLRRGLGVAAFVEEAAASVCYSACTSGEIAEVDVATLDRFRGRGLARAVTAQFVSRCLERGLAPSWDCFDYNEASLRLALGVGFEEDSRYPLYSVNT